MSRRKAASCASAVVRPISASWSINASRSAWTLSRNNAPSRGCASISAPNWVSGTKRITTGVIEDRVSTAWSLHMLGVPNMSPGRWILRIWRLPLGRMCDAVAQPFSSIKKPVAGSPSRRISRSRSSRMIGPPSARTASASSGVSVVKSSNRLNDIFSRYCPLTFFR